MRKLTIPSVFTAIDKFSKPVDKMSRSASASFERMDRNMRKTSQKFGEMSKKSAIATAAIIAPLALLANEAVKFEDKMADVAKVANVDLGGTAFQKMSEDAKTLGIELGLSASESAELMANLAQGGVHISELNEVSRIAGKMAVAFGMSGDMAGESFIKTKNALGGTIKETQKVMDVINMFGNTTAAASNQLVEFMASGGSGVARAANASGEELAAFGAQFISMGKSASESATIMERFIKTALSDKKIRGVFDKAGGGAKGMFAVIEKGSKLSGKAQDEYFSNFGQYGLSIQLLAKNLDGPNGLTEKLRASRDEMANAGSVNKEFDNRTKTSAFKLAQMKSQLTSLAIDLGTVLIPIINDLVSSLMPVIKGFANWAKTHKGTVTFIAKMALGVAALTGTFSLFTGAISLVFKGLSGIAQVLGIVSKAFIFLSGPVGIAVLAIGALATAGYLAYNSINGVSDAQRLQNEVMDRAKKNTLDQRVEVALLFKTLRRAKEGSEEYSTALSKIEEMQPGITKQFNLQVKSIDALNSAEKSLTQSIIKRAEEQARDELIVKKTTEAMARAENGPTWGDYLASLGTAVGTLGFGYMSPTDFVNRDVAQLYKDRDIVADQQAQAVNPKQTESNVTKETISKSTKEVTLDFINLPSFVKIGGLNTGSLSMPSGTSTRATI